MRRMCIVIETPEGRRIENTINYDETSDYTPPWGFLMPEAEARALYPELEPPAPEESENTE